MSNTTLGKILVVDDEQEALDYLSNILKSANYEVISTTKGRQAVELVKNQKPDLILLDIVIPDMSGGEIARTLSEIDSTCKIPIIFLSGLNTPEDVQIIREKTGDYNILSKPTSPEEVLKTIAKALKKE